MKQLTAYTRNDFRKWLSKNHSKETKVEVIVYKKHTGKLAPSHKELMEEAICYGWIDTVIKKLDENKYIRTFSKRNNASKWSKNTLSYARDLIKRKLMTPFGLKFYKEGLKKKPHDHGIPKNPCMPTELKKELDKNEKAKFNFQKLAPSVKKMHYRWILRGKRQETRDKRVSLIVKGASPYGAVISTQKKVNN